MGASSQTPEFFGKYPVIKSAGTNQLYSLFIGKNADTSQQVVLKNPHAGLLSDVQFKNIWIEWLQSLRPVGHHNIQSVLDVVQTSTETTAIVAEWLDGFSCKDLLQRHHSSDRVLDLHIGLYIIAEACNGLDFLHSHHHGPGSAERGMVHHGISPETLLITRNGEVKLIDFELAPLRQRFIDRALDSSPYDQLAYLAPEQLNGSPVDARSDIFSLGLILLELLTQTPLDGSKSHAALIRMVENKDTKLLQDIDETAHKKLIEILHTAISEEPEQRYSAANRMYMDVLHALILLAPGNDFVTELQQFIAEAMAIQDEATAGSNLTGTPNANSPAEASQTAEADPAAQTDSVSDDTASDAAAPRPGDEEDERPEQTFQSSSEEEVTATEADFLKAAEAVQATEPEPAAQTDSVSDDTASDAALPEPGDDGNEETPAILSDENPAESDEETASSGAETAGQETAQITVTGDADADSAENVPVMELESVEEDNSSGHEETKKEPEDAQDAEYVEVDDSLSYLQSLLKGRKQRKHFTLKEQSGEPVEESGTNVPELEEKQEPPTTDTESKAGAESQDDAVEHEPSPGPDTADAPLSENREENVSETVQPNDAPEATEQELPASDGADEDEAEHEEAPAEPVLDEADTAEPETVTGEDKPDTVASSIGPAESSTSGSAKEEQTPAGGDAPAPSATEESPASSVTDAAGRPAARPTDEDTGTPHIEVTPYAEPQAGAQQAAAEENKKKTASETPEAQTAPRPSFGKNNHQPHTEEPAMRPDTENTSSPSQGRKLFDNTSRSTTTQARYKATEERTSLREKETATGDFRARVNRHEPGAARSGAGDPQQEQATAGHKKSGEQIHTPSENGKKTSAKAERGKKRKKKKRSFQRDKKQSASGDEPVLRILDDTRDEQDTSSRFYSIIEDEPSEIPKVAPDFEHEEIKTIIDVVRISARRNKHKLLLTGLVTSVLVFLFAVIDIFAQITPIGADIYDIFFPPAIRIETIPAGAEVYLNDKPLQATTPLRLDEIPPGVHKLMLALPSFDPIIKSIHVPGSGELIIDGEKARLADRAYVFRFTVQLELSSQPQGATVHINDKTLAEKTPTTVKWEVSDQPIRIEMSRENFPKVTGLSIDPLNAQESIEDKRFWRFQRLHKRKPHFAIEGVFRKPVAIESLPEGAEIILNEEQYQAGITGLNNVLYLTPGDHFITLRKQGYLPRRFRLRVDENTPESITEVLPRLVSISAVASHAGIDEDLSARIVELRSRENIIPIDKETPTELKLLPYTYTATLRKKGYKDAYVRISPNQREVRVSMQVIPADLFLTVVNSRTGKRIEGVRLRYKTGAGLNTSDEIGTTDESGRLLSKLAPGFYRITAEKDGYTSQTKNIRIQSGRRNRLTFRLRRSFN